MEVPPDIGIKYTVPCTKSLLLLLGIVIVKCEDEVTDIVPTVYYDLVRPTEYVFIALATASASFSYTVTSLAFNSLASTILTLVNKIAIAIAEITNFLIIFFKLITSISVLDRFFSLRRGLVLILLHQKFDC